LTLEYNRLGNSDFRGAALDNFGKVDSCGQLVDYLNGERKDHFGDLADRKPDSQNGYTLTGRFISEFKPDATFRREGHAVSASRSAKVSHFRDKNN